MNTIIGFVAIFWILAPAVYCTPLSSSLKSSLTLLLVTNTFDSAFLPISTYYAFDNFGMPYNASLVMTDGLFDVEKYRAYSPLFVSATLAIEYGLAFACFSAVMMHTFRKCLPSLCVLSSHIIP